jgi:hypothetical protein
VGDNNACFDNGLCRVPDRLSGFEGSNDSHRNEAIRNDNMPQFANGSFDPETVVVLRGAVDRAWRALPHDRQTAQNKSLIADAVVKHATAGERDPLSLSHSALRTLSPGAGDGAL